MGAWQDSSKSLQLDTRPSACSAFCSATSCQVKLLQHARRSGTCSGLHSYTTAQVQLCSTRMFHHFIPAVRWTIVSLCASLASTLVALRLELRVRMLHCAPAVLNGKFASRSNTAKTIARAPCTCECSSASLLGAAATPVHLSMLWDTLLAQFGRPGCRIDSSDIETFILSTVTMHGSSSILRHSIRCSDFPSNVSSGYCADASHFRTFAGVRWSLIDLVSWSWFYLSV